MGFVFEAISCAFVTVLLFVAELRLPHPDSDTLRGGRKTFLNEEKPKKQDQNAAKQAQPCSHEVFISPPWVPSFVHQNEKWGVINIDTKKTDSDS